MIGLPPIHATHGIGRDREAGRIMRQSFVDRGYRFQTMGQLTPGVGLGVGEGVGMGVRMGMGLGVWVWVWV